MFPDEYELKIRQEIARVYKFSLHEKHAKCSICGTRFMYNYYGMGLNERMERHYNTQHSTIVWRKENGNS